MEQAFASTELAAADPIIVVDELVLDNTTGDFSLDDIRISKTNRKHFNEEALARLAENINRVGILQAIIIRPVTPTDDEPEHFEIVAGERRYRAAKIAGLTIIPVKVRHLSDRDAAEIQILENIQREDPHEMEEAEGFQSLMLNYAYTADQLAEKIGKSRSHVYNRLKLCSLAIGCRDQFLDRKFSASIALLISRIPVPELQIKAMEEILNPSNGAEPMSYRFAHQYIQRRYMLNLGDATFPIKDAKLLAAAGSCISCPKRTGNDPIIFADVDPNICTDPDCFSEKIAANAAKKITWANKNGIEIIEGDEAEKITRNAKYNPQSEFVTEEIVLCRMARRKPEYPSTDSIRTHLDSKAFPKVAKVTRDNHGNVTTLYLKTQVQTCLEKAGICYAEEEYEEHLATIEAQRAAITGSTPSTNKRQAEEEALAKQEELVRLVKDEQQYRFALYKKLRNRAGQGLDLDSLKILLKHIINHFAPDAIDEDLSKELYGIAIDNNADMSVYIDQATIEQAQLLLIDFLLGEALIIPNWRIETYLDREDDEQFAAIQAMAVAEGISLELIDENTPSTAAPEPETTSEPIAAPKKRSRKSATTTIEESSKSNAAEPWPFPTAARSV